MRLLGRLATWLVTAAAVVFALPAAAEAAAAPQIVGAYTNDATNLSAPVSVAVSGNIAYATAYASGELTAIDYSTPSAPKLSGASSPFLDLNLIGGSNIAIAGGYAFVVSKNRNASTTSNDDGNGNSLTILDMHTNPSQPAIVGTIRDTGKLFGSYGIAVKGNYAYVAYQGLLSGQPTAPDTSTGGFSVIDITNPAGPTIVANIDNGSLTGANANALQHATSVAISGQYAYVNAFMHHDIAVIDISNPLAPKIVNVLNDSTNLNLVVDLAIQGNFLYAADQAGGSAPQLTVVDISSPTAPKVAATLSNASVLAGAYRIRVRGDFAYESASSAAAVGVIDISNPLQPRLASWAQSSARLNKTTGLDLSPSGQFVIASSPYLSTQANTTFPPYPLQSGGPSQTGTISVIKLDPNPISVTIAAASKPANPTTSTSASFSFSVNDGASAVRCQLDAGPLAPCTSATTQTYSGLSTGSHTFTVQASDTAGNTSTSSYTWTIDTTPANSAPPTVSGSAVVGQTLTASNGTWSGTPAPTFTYSWADCDSTGANCTPIAGATASTYTVQSSDVGSTLEVTVTGTNPVGAATASSSPTGVVVAPPPPPPANTGQPAISGSATVGSQLSASQGTWTNSPTGFAYQWSDCDSTGTSCNAIAGATASTYTVQSGDVGFALEVAVTASNAGGQSAPASSNPTGVVPAAPSNPSPPPAISGTAAVGSVLTASSGTWSGTGPFSYAYQWSDCDSTGNACSAITGATSSTYTVQSTDVGSTLEVTVTATGPGGSAHASSSPTAVVAAPPPPPPANTGQPAISGSATVGSQLSASQGTWTNSPTGFAYQWSDCDSTGATCNAITGATSSTYTVQSTDAGFALEVAVTASNAGGQSAPASSNPTGVVPAAPSNPNPPPAIAGTPTTGSPLAASPGTWSGTGPFSYTYQWLRCTPSCSAIGAPSASNVYTPVAADAGATLEVTVTATGPGGSGQATSNATATVTEAPQNTAVPTISGSAVQGKTLTASPGGWAAYPAPAYSYQWQRCNQSGGSCANISAATASTYVLQRTDMANTVRVAVTAANNVGTPSSAASATTATVAGPPVNTSVPLVSGTTTQGNTLTTTSGAWTGYPTPTYTYQWRRCNTLGEACTAISGATSTTYTLTSADVGFTLRAYVTAANTAGSVLARSAQTAVIQPGVSTGAAILGVAGGAPQLRIAADAGPGMPALARVVIKLPGGMSFAKLENVVHALRVLDRGGHRLAVSASLRHGALVLVLHKPPRSLTVEIGAAALSVTHPVEVRVRDHPGTVAQLKLTVTDASGGVVRLSVRFRLR